MRALFRPACLLFYLLATINSFLLGMFYAGISGAGTNQGLAGGAIVFGYGVSFGVLALILSFFVAFYVKIGRIVTLNKILALNLLVVIAVLAYRINSKKINSSSVKSYTNAKYASVFGSTQIPPLIQQDESEMGLGMFAPTQSDNQPFFFYGNPNFEKSIIDHSPNDSITFKRVEIGQFDIATAPPWLQPHHLKLDYGVLYFKVISISEDFIEVVVNTTTKQTAYVDRRAGQMLYWPDFFHNIHSVEFISTQKVFVRPFDYAGTVPTSFSFMRPIKIKQEWMQVILINDGFDPVGKGWIKWHEKGKLLIRYNLFS